MVTRSNITSDQRTQLLFPVTGTRGRDPIAAGVQPTGRARQSVAERPPGRQRCAGQWSGHTDSTSLAGAVPMTKDINLALMGAIETLMSSSKTVPWRVLFVKAGGVVNMTPWN